MLKKTSFLTRLAAIALLLPWAPAADAQTAYPAHPIRLIVPYAPGGSNDILARLIGQKMGSLLGTQMVIDNRPGAGGSIGVEAAAKSPADGYTLVIGHVGTFSINPAVYKKLGYDPLKDFAPIGLISMVPNVLVVNASLPVHSVRELIALAKSQPGKLAYGSGGNGSAAHLAVEHFKSMAGVDILHVPYKGTAPLLTDMIAGQLSMTITGLLPVQPFLKSGRLRIIATASPQRLKVMPDLPTIAESGVPGYAATQWYGLLAPANTPPAIGAALSKALRDALKSKDILERLTAEGAEPVDSTPQSFHKFMEGELALWARIAKSSNAHVD
jgi:tripartite-type tricarboxylate transporter receptor subunit TctC